MEAMSIKDDIEALEKGIEWEGHGDFRGTHHWHKACRPDRIRRLLDALKEAEFWRGQWEGMCNQFRLVHEAGRRIEEINKSLENTQAAKLSKACELLKDIRENAEVVGYFDGEPLPPQALAEKIDAFLREAGHE